MGPIYIRLAKNHQDEVVSRSIGLMVNIDRVPGSDEVYGVEVIDAEDVEFDGVSIKEIKAESLSRHRKLQFTRQVSERRNKNMLAAQEDLRAAKVELAQWRSCFGESALRDHQLEVSRLRARARAEVVLPTEASNMIYSFLTGWFSALDDHALTEDHLLDLARGIVESLEGENELAELRRAGGEPDDDLIWRVLIEVPTHLSDAMRETLFESLAGVLHTWEPENRTGWDSFLAAHVVDPLNRVPSPDDIEQALAVLRAVPHCSYVGPMTGAECIIPVKQAGAYCPEHTKAMVDMTNAMAEMRATLSKEVRREDGG